MKCPKCYIDTSLTTSKTCLCPQFWEVTKEICPSCGTPYEELKELNGDTWQKCPCGKHIKLKQQGGGEEMRTTYHRVFNPKMETIQGVTADVDKLEQGWKLVRVCPVTDYEWVAVFDNTLPPTTKPTKGDKNGK